MLDKSFLQKPVYGARPETGYIKRVLPDEIMETPPNNCKRILIDASPCGSPRYPLNSAVPTALCNVRRPFVWFGVPRAHFREHAHDVRNDISRFLEHDCVAHAHIKPFYFIFIVESRARNDGTGDGTRL